jgi:hypothetical protein
MAPKIIPPGTKFGRLTVLGPAPTKGHGRRWRCRCDCGADIVVGSWSLRSGKATSCGCRRRDLVTARLTMHGQIDDPAYRVWVDMRSRCLSPASKAFRYYGGRGITICPAWDRFATFLADVGPRPSRKHSIDRIDNNRGYEPGNVRWATRREQMRNTRRNQWIEFGGERLVVSDWAIRLGIPKSTLRHRLRMGWPVERALVSHLT